jgi:NAD(P)H-dependent FMN reductase
VKRLLFVHHTVSPATAALFDSALAGARHPDVRGVEVVVRPALTAAASDVLEADGYLLGSPVNLGYLAGALKHFFDTVYYPCREASGGRPYGCYLHAGGGETGATGAVRALEGITAGLGWRAVQRPLVVTGAAPDALAAVGELAAAVSAWLALDG